MQKTRQLRKTELLQNTVAQKTNKSVISIVL